MKLKNILLIGTLAAGSIGFSEAQKTAQPKSTHAVKAGKVDPHFVKARDSYDKGDLAASASEIRAAAAQITVNTTGGDSALLGPVKKTTADLDKLALRVGEGKIKEGSTLNKNFATASNAMANYHAAVAKKATGNKKGLIAGASLNRTADYIENTAKWSGQKLGDAGKNTVIGMRNTGGSLVKAGGTIVEGTGTVIGKGLGLIGNLGRTIIGKASVEKKGPNIIEKTGQAVKKGGEKIEEK